MFAVSFPILARSGLLREVASLHRPQGYEPCELLNCSIPQCLPVFPGSLLVQFQVNPGITRVVAEYLSGLCVHIPVVRGTTENVKCIRRGRTDGFS